MSGKRIGYIRVSTVDQKTLRQLADLQLDKVFTEYASAKNLDRPELKAMLEYIREDDELFVHSTDRLARSVRDLVYLVDHLVGRKITVHFIKQNLIFSGNDSSMSKFQLHILGAVAELERAIILERQREGIAQAKRMGKYAGRPSKLTEEMSQKITAAMSTRDSKSQIAKDLGISRFCLYNYLKKMGCKA